MAKYIVRRLLATIPVLFGLSIVLFVFVHLLPGDPATALLGQHATPELVAKIREQLGLDKPLWEQYLQYLGQLLHGDFGKSILDNRPILEEFFTRFPGTIELTIGALIFAVGLGIPLGRFGARHVQGWGDGLVTVISLLGISIPIFVLGLTLQFFLAVTLHWLPATSSLDPRLLNSVPPVTNFLLVDTLLAGRPDAFVDALRHLILPSIALGSIPLAIITRITRASVLDVSNEDYVRTARAKGLKERRVDSRHVMRNAWLPVVTVIGLQVGGLLAGAVITETIFAWDGVGRWAVQAIQGHDYIVVQSVITIFAFIFLIVNLIVDIGYAFLNPRIRYG
ncbi:MAG TPA: ABC transporter permease [Candidatus Limnocylindrales bacterium]|nr:ABC transporter permease [Candidatus Limnocylindrales bacterium]